MEPNCQIYNRHVLDQGRDYAEALVLEGSVKLCEAYLAIHQTLDDALVMEQTSLPGVGRARRMSVWAAIPAPNWPQPDYVRRFRLALEAAHV